MSLLNTRILAFFILIVIILTKEYHILYYLPVMILSIEFLNRNNSYLINYEYKILNLLFTGYLLLISIERGRHFNFPSAIEIITNSMEHLLFGFIICLKLTIYYCIYQKEKKIELRELWRLVFIFNVLGIVNEFFQNWYKHQSVWQLTFDSKKDILMNIIGSLVFIQFYQRINKSIQNQVNAKNDITVID